MTEEEFDNPSPREVLDGDWLTGRQAIEFVEDLLRRNGSPLKWSAGEVIIRLAAFGYLPSISNEVTHSVPIEDGGSEASIPTDKDRTDGWRLVPTAIWAAAMGISTIEGKKHILVILTFG